MRQFSDIPIGHMSYELYKRIFENGIPYAVKLNWRGEPLLHKQIVNMIRYAKKKGVLDVLMNSNGLLINKELIFDLAEAGLDWIIFSVDGATPETYNKIRQGGDFEKLVKNIILTQFVLMQVKNRPKIRIQICEQPINQHEIEEWRELFGGYADQLRIGKLFDPQGKAGYRIPQPISCNSPWQRLTIAWNGDIFCCPGDFLEKIKLGNIKDTSVREAWHSEQMNTLRKTLKRYGRKASELCRKCTSYCK
jgi:radical SAM protein with 4Fe4S-binding SPASM domain